MKDSLGSCLAPSHARAVQTHADEMAHRPLDEATGDDEALPTKPVVAHSVSVFDEVVDRVFEHLPPVLVARSGNSSGVERGAERRDDVFQVAVSELSLLLVDPRFERL